MAGFELLESRRLTGPNLFWNHPGAVIDLAVPAELDAAALGRLWATEARQRLRAVGWGQHQTHARTFTGGISLVLSAPVDALYAACELNEMALAAAQDRFRTGADRSAPAESEPAVSEIEQLRSTIAAEVNPPLLALKQAAEERGVAFLSDDEVASVGLGTGSVSWPVDALPDPSEVPWDDVHDVPVLVVTGTNGKTTTVRLLASIMRAAGLVAGSTSTDGITVGGDLVDAGDWSGPGGARAVARDRRVEIALLEAARGGLLRRGLGVVDANAAAVTNVAADHMGEFGVSDLDELADVKLVVTRAAEHGVVVLNADDEHLTAAVKRRAESGSGPLRITWCTLHPTRPEIQAHLARGGVVCTIDDSELVILEGRDRTQVTGLSDIPVCLGGAARHNVYNALTAAGLARAVGVSAEDIARGLAAIGGSADDNRGRGNFFRFGTTTALVDFAHNPHGLAALGHTVEQLPHARLLVAIGQAGDRDDHSIRALARAALEMGPDRILIKELDAYRRGRQPGEVPGLLEDELQRSGAAADLWAHAGSDTEAARMALAWAQEGDMLVLTVQSELAAVLALMADLDEAGWRAGAPLP